MTDSLNFKDTAEVYRIGLLIGFFQPADVVRWADAVILTSEKPDPCVIDVSLSEKKPIQDIAHLLKDIKGESHPTLPAHVLMGLMGRKLSENPGLVKRIATMAYSLAIDGKVSNDERDWLICFDDDFELAERGIFGTAEALTKELQDRLLGYSLYAELFSPTPNTLVDE